MVPKLKKSWCRTERRFSIANLNEKAGLIENGSGNFHLQAQTGHPQSSCHLQLHPPCHWTKMTFQTARDQLTRFYHIIPGLCQLVKDQFVAMLASVGEFQAKGCLPFFWKMKKNLGVSKFQSAPKIWQIKKNWLYPKKVETSRRLKVCFLPPFCNQWYRCCTACWRSSRFLCSAWNTCRPALQLNGTADFTYLRRYNQLTLPLCILRPSILHLQPFIPPKTETKRRVHQYIFTQNRMPPSHYTASLLLRWRSLLGSHHLRHPAIPHGRPSASNMSFKVHIGQKRLDSKAKLKYYICSFKLLSWQIPL